MDRDRLLRGSGTAEPLDDLVLVLPRGAAPIRPSLGFDFYEADLCLPTREKRLAAVAIDACCFHNQRAVELPPDFEASGAGVRGVVGPPAAREDDLCGGGWEAARLRAGDLIARSVFATLSAFDCQWSIANAAIDRR
jgi:hypothetical protein